MKQIWITRPIGPDGLEIKEATLAPPGPGQMTVEIKAAGFNFADLMASKGLYPDAPKLPCVVGYEVSGTVEAVGEGVDRHWLGKGVFAFTRFGGYSEKINLPLEQVFERPNNLSPDEAAALPVNYITAYQLVVAMGGLRKGETILIHNAGGGVGLAALQFARKIGAVTLGTASAGKHAFLKAQGLDEAIDYRTGDWEKEVLRITGGKGVELILDPIGGASWRKNYKLLRPSGRLGVYGISSASLSKGPKLLTFLNLLARMPFFNPVSLMNNNRGVFGANLGHLWGETEKVKGWFTEILKGVRDGWLKPYVDRTFRFSEAAEAFRYVEQRKNTGKILLIP